MKTLDFKHYICLVMIAFAMGLVSCSDSSNEPAIDVEDASEALLNLETH